MRQESDESTILQPRWKSYSMLRRGQSWQFFASINETFCQTRAGLSGRVGDVRISNKSWHSAANIRVQVITGCEARAGPLLSPLYHRIIRCVDTSLPVWARTPLMCWHCMQELISARTLLVCLQCVPEHLQYNLCNVLIVCGGLL